MRSLPHLLLLSALVSVLLLVPQTEATGSTAPAVAINEVAWAGTAYSTKDEWIELINNTATDIDLTGWVLRARDGRPRIVLRGVIPAYGYFLLERRDDNTVADIPADQIYRGALENRGEILELRDPSGKLIDSANGDGGRWPAGNRRKRASMERICATLPDTDSNWATNDRVTRNGQDAGGGPINGTPKAPNSQQSCGPTAITLVRFQAIPQAQGGVLLTWETGTEIDNVGFHLYRGARPEGPFELVNERLIPATGDPLTGGEYTFLDTTAPPGTTYYVLEDVDANGTRTTHGPVSVFVQAQSTSYGPSIFLPIVTAVGSR